MKEYIEERAIELAMFIIDEESTVRAAAKKFGISKSTVYIVITLNETEKETLKTFNKSARSGLELRDKACILLGTEMGIRGCDIVNLKFSDINWKDRSICFRQRKTWSQVWLSMPVSAGNAIYHYLKDGRPNEAKCDI